MATAPLHSALLQTLGQSIANGELNPSRVLTLDEVCVRHSVSRSVARDAVGSLEALGMLESRRRVGIIVLPMNRWDVLNSQVIRWRLNGPDRDRQLEALTLLRLGVEPIAAASTAQHIDGSTALELRDLSLRMAEHGQAGRRAEFIELDARFHELILTNSGNELYAALSTPVLAAINGRSEVGLMPDHPVADAIQLHHTVAEAIVERDATTAEHAMRDILSEVRSAVAEVAAPR
ncbi:FadR/GntR family transcriptional regulator [Microbacterium alcoholitolerans]|uniref:FadR/GntR family transcriptional regulator n=1 Tax=unclassified Microbacterium TaxID=2609290 RepID=UPI003D16A900